jgi:hypothetical protein
MPIVVTPEIGIPLPVDTTPEEIIDFREKARALFKTVETLAAKGVEIEITDSDRQLARHHASTGAISRDKATPGSIVHLESILNEWDKEVLDVGHRLRNYVTNKLILESTDPDPKVRLKALEHLGKISSVGLFSERVDISVTHRSITDIEADLKRTLELYSGDVIDVTPINPQKSLESLDLDEEFGLDDVAAGEGDGR